VSKETRVAQWLAPPIEIPIPGVARPPKAELPFDMAVGSFKAGRTGRIRIKFPKKFKTVPFVIVIGDLREGEPKLELPEIKVPEIKIPKVTIRIPTRPNFVDRIKKILGNWGAFNWLRNAIAKGIGRILNWLWDNLIKPTFDDIEDAINKGVEEDVKNTMESLKALADNLVSAFNFSNNQLVGVIRDFLGVSKGFFITPCTKVGETEEYFEIEGIKGAKFTWIAIAPRESKG